MLESLETDCIQANLLYLKQRFWQRTPKTLNILAWRLHHRKTNKQIPYIACKDGTRTYQSAEILLLMAVFYKKLYSSNTPPATDINKVLKDHNFNKNFL